MPQCILILLLLIIIIIREVFCYPQATCQLKYSALVRVHTLKVSKAYRYKVINTQWPIHVVL